MKLLKEELWTSMLYLRGQPASPGSEIIHQLVGDRIYFPVLGVVYDQLSSPVRNQVKAEIEGV